MRWWQTLVPFFIGEGALHEAVKEGQIVKIAGLLKQGFNIDYYYRNYTPLQLSLLHRQYHCTLFLLKYGANPNLRCYSSIEENQGPTIEPYLKVWVSPYNSQFTAIKQRNESIIRLLTLHGATNVVFPSSTAYYEVLPSFREVYEETQYIRTKILALQHTIKERPPLIAYEACTQLQQIWQKLASDEVNPIFKGFYQEKAKYCCKKATALRATIPVEEKTTADGEKTSLLTTARSQTVLTP